MIQKYPTLYARTSTGAVQIWYMEQDEDKYRSTSGQQDGQKVVAEWTTAKPKNVGRSNETNAVQQATLEIDAKYEKQLKSGGYFLDIKDIDIERFFQVMLAKNYEDYQDDLDWKLGVGVQIKFNGGRIVARKSGLWTRKGERYVSIPHIEEALKPFFVKFPDAVLDGEGFNYDLRENLKEIMKLMRKTVHITPKDLARSKELIRYYVYDGFGFPELRDGRVTTADSHYLSRKSAIDNAFFAPCFASRYRDVIEKVRTWVVHSPKELNDLYQQFLADKQEGAIIRVLKAPYENKRSKYLLKYKPVDDAEFRAISVQEGDGKFAGRVSTVTYQRIDGKKFLDGTDTFNATFKGTEEEAIELWVSKEYEKLIGEIHTVYFNGLTGFGKPNYARLDWNNYIKGH